MPRVRRKRGRKLLLVAVAALLAWLFWPAAAPPPEPVAVAVAKPTREPEPAKVPPKKVAPKPPPKVAAASVAPAAYMPDREKLLEAIRERSREIAACSLPPGSPAVLPVRLRISRAGEVRSARFTTGAPLPEALSTCARSKIDAWKFADLGLKSDVEILVSFELGRP